MENSMQREVIFKAIRQDNHSWIEGDLIRNNHSGRTLISTKDLVIQICDTEDHTCICLEARDVIPETICFYSGYEDQNETKIFSGDIIDDGGMNRGDVELDPDCGWIVNTSHAVLPLSQLCNYSTVTGNIHDHHTTSKESP